MYVGHAAIAVALKAREPRVPVVPLLLAAYGPDWAEAVLGAFHGRQEMRLLTHTLPMVALGALLAAGLYALLWRRPGAPYVAAAWLLHWPADFLTARKPLMGPGELVGLDLYHLPAADFALESFLVVACCVLYARSYAKRPGQHGWVAAMAATLIALQGVLDYGLAHSGETWQPLVAPSEWRPHLAFAAPAGGTSACVLHSRVVLSQRARDGDG